ncbi:MAG TPA: D-2-hydroxyacid dehydrogenase [Candidatus Sulfotelmatobacter sp.]|nr:D-2-hydroxyacid dehydrogenase [Candidatus Sulfotelmatobacter sp.]
MLPPPDRLTICFAHVAYQLQQRFALRQTGIAGFEVRERAALDRRVGEADVLVISGLWHDGLLERAGRLAYIQSIGAGTDQFPRARLAERGIRLASAQGVNAHAVADHAMALVLALARKLPAARDNQARQFWRPMIGNISEREDELGGKTLLIVGLGRIGARLARLARAFDMRVIGLRRNPAAADAGEVHGIEALARFLPEADFVALTCPLTPETEKLIDAAALARMRPGAYLVNVARGRVVDQAALVAALRDGRLAGAALDVTEPEPLPPDAPFWSMPNVLITPHVGGETRRYEDNVLDILQENLARLWRGETTLRNQIV